MPRRFAFLLEADSERAKSADIQASNPNDIDDDGIPNETDKCPDEAENYNDFKDDDGCPDALATVYLRATHYDKPVEDLSIALTGAGGTIMATTTLQPVEISDLRPGIYDIRAFSSQYEGNLQTRLRGGENRIDLEIYPTEPGTSTIVAVDDQNVAAPTLSQPSRPLVAEMVFKSTWIPPIRSRRASARRIHLIHPSP